MPSNYLITSSIFNRGSYDSKYGFVHLLVDHDHRGMDQFHSRKGGGEASGGSGGFGQGQDRGKRSIESSGWSLDETKGEWRKVQKSDQSNPSGPSSWFNYGASSSSRAGHGSSLSPSFQSSSKYKQEDNYRLRSESMREEMTRNYIKPPPNRVVHCCSFPCLCQSDTNQLPQKSSKQHHHHHQRDDQSDDRDRKGSSNWFKLPSQDRHGSK